MPADLPDDLDISVEMLAALEESKRRSQPDYGITVYCDTHLGVKMCRAVSFGQIEYGGAADVNPLDHWRCPKPSCIRCYEPTMFGYYWHSGIMGSQIVRDVQNQPRCGAHPGQPYMYIAKVAQGRIYRCPFYKCNEQNDEVATFVLDENVQIPADPLVGVKKVDRQKAEEMAVFNSFMSASGLRMDPGSAVSRDPPFPDLLCTIDGEPHTFELAEVISETVAEKTNPKRRNIDGGFSYSQDQAFLKIIGDKRLKQYETQGAPVELVLYFNLRWGSKPAMQSQIQAHADVLGALVNAGPFRRVWIYDTHTKAVIWRSAWNDESTQ